MWGRVIGGSEGTEKMVGSAGGGRQTARVQPGGSMSSKVVVLGLGVGNGFVRFLIDAYDQGPLSP